MMHTGWHWVEQLEQTRSRNLMRSRRYDNKHLIRKSGRVIPDEYFRLNIALGWAAKGKEPLLSGWPWQTKHLTWMRPCLLSYQF